MELSIETKDLTKCFKTQKKGDFAIKGIDLSITPGQLFGLIGPDEPGGEYTFVSHAHKDHIACIAELTTGKILASADVCVWALRPNIRRLLDGTERGVGWRARKTKGKENE